MDADALEPEPLARLVQGSAHADLTLRDARGELQKVTIFNDAPHRERRPTARAVHASRAWAQFRVACAAEVLLAPQAGCALWCQRRLYLAQPSDSPS